MAAQAKGFSEASSVLMVGLDPKAIIEHKEKEKMMMPNKKVTETELYYMNFSLMSRLLRLAEVIRLAPSSNYTIILVRPNLARIIDIC